MLKQSLRALFAAGPVFTALCGASGADYQADVVIYGGSSGGITAALAAARNGKSVIVVEPSAHIGGMTTSGLGQVDIMRKESLGGITLEYFKRNAAEVENSRMYWVTPKAGEQTFLNMVNEEDGITLLRSSRLKEGEGAVTKDGSRIESITLENGDRVSGKIFIDGSYEGDLLAAAGISYIVGRESSSQYGESGAGIRPSLELPYADAYDENGELYPDLVEDVPGKVGDADPNTQAYNFRLCMTTDPENRIAAVKPENYDRKDYHNLLKMVQAQPNKQWTFNDIISYWGLLSGGKKADINNRGDFSSDMINHSHNWAEASYAERDEIYKRHKDYTMGLLYFICNDPELPECLREDSSKWGLAADEFTDNDFRFEQIKIARNDGTNYADYLLSGIPITAITIDAANRKWLGTSNNGVYLVSADGQEMLQHFTTDNSPLLSNSIQSIAIDPKTGVVMIGTTNGLISYASDANTPSETLEKDLIHAFPNPVRPDYNGLVSVTGLTDNANVKITSVTGQLIYEGTSNGGLFTWNGRTKSGQRVASGVYNVIASTSDGKESVVTRITFIR